MARVPWHRRADVPNVVLGLMRIQDKTDEEVRTLVGTALDAGIDFMDHADVYGSDLHGCERRFAEAMQLTPAEREQIVMQSKAGIVREGPYFDFSVRAHRRVGRRLARGARHGLPRHAPAAPARRPGRARGGRAGVRRARGRRQGARFGVSNHTPRPDRAAASSR